MAEVNLELEIEIDYAGVFNRVLENLGGPSGLTVLEPENLKSILEDEYALPKPHLLALMHAADNDLHSRPILWEIDPEDIPDYHVWLHEEWNKLSEGEQDNLRWIIQPDEYTPWDWLL